MRRGFFVIAIVTVGGCLLSIAACDADAPSRGLGTSPVDPLVVALAPGENELHLGASAVAGNPIRLQIESNSADASYRTTWTLGPGTCLSVVPRTGDSLVVTGAPIVADYYHAGRVLGVTIGTAPAQRFMAFGEPIRWETVPCPTP